MWLSDTKNLNNLQLFIGFTKDSHYYHVDISYNRKNPRRSKNSAIAKMNDFYLCIIVIAEDSRI